ncbi:hypothetical protein [Caulobacter sp. SSI4214]|uniref:hypothetical protein n=1 Tax=Caulobacter sp. SSI4214 TaxID=2575739 RepID=UPI0014388E97|nr:hypothetical protein [Caulobacter sp. SSI4214]
MRDVGVMTLLWLGGFFLGMVWAFIAARRLFMRRWKVLSLSWGAFCASMWIFFSAVSLLGLGHKLFGWVTH